MIDTSGLVEIRWHGRGGQGAVTSAELLARAAIDEGKYAQAFPSFGPERRGAPVLAFDRIDPKKQIRIRAEIIQPDVIVVLDSSLLRVVNVTAGLKPNGLMIVNTKRSIKDLESEYKFQLAVIDASSIARELLGVNIVNTTLLGAVVKATGVINIESLNEPINERFGRLGEKNIAAMKRAFSETVIKESAAIG